MKKFIVVKTRYGGFYDPIRKTSVEECFCKSIIPIDNILYITENEISTFIFIKSCNDVIKIECIESIEKIERMFKED